MNSRIITKEQLNKIYRAASADRRDSKFQMRTLDDAFRYTTKYKWAPQKSFESSGECRVRQILTHIGCSIPLKQLTKPYWWTESQSDLLDALECQNANVNRILSFASTAIDFTYQQELHQFRRPSFAALDESENSRQAWFTKEQVQKLAFIADDIFDNQNLSDAIIFSAYTGLRQGELLLLKPEDVHFEYDCISLGYKKGRQTKTKQGRDIPIHKLVRPIIERRMTNKQLFGDDWLNKDQLYKQFLKVRKYAGFCEDYVWHSFRHSFCTWACAVHHPRVVMDIAGHRRIETTLRYAKVSDESARACIAAI
tara:strand:+ start:165 stop:1094 length:930 start_codon:yes stop_codon:yes gene_type:complete